MALSGRTVPTHPVQGPRCYLCTKKDQRRILRSCRRDGMGDCEGGEGMGARIPKSCCFVTLTVFYIKGRGSSERLAEVRAHISPAITSRLRRER